MTTNKSKRHWLIRGFDSMEIIYERKVDAGQITEGQMKDLIRALAAKAGLTYDEILGAYATRRTKIANDLLRVGRDGPNPSFTCGSNPHFVVTLLKSRPADILNAGTDGKVSNLSIP